MSAIKMELSHLGPLKHTAPVAACTVCSIYVNFNIPCRHIIPRFEPIPLHMIPARWRLFPERTVSAFAEATQCSLNQPGANSIDVIRSEASKCFYEIEEKMAALKDLSQATIILEKLKIKGRQEDQQKKKENEKKNAKKNTTSTIPSPLNQLRINIDKTKVEYILNAVADGNCGFGCIAYAIYGDEDRVFDVKEKMLELYYKYKNTLYKSKY
ncbi:hypothetical protein RMATCC62417_10374 [Rhizopus microsporus]|nr:hypothetical protein RMATCC62417_10374 [Rhizopus microsporus]